MVEIFQVMEDQAVGARRRSHKHIAPDAHNKQRRRKHDASHAVRANVAASFEKKKKAP